MGEGQTGKHATPVAHLVLLGAEGEPQQWPLQEGTLILGRAKDCGISIADPRLSRRHTELRCEGRKIIAADLGSVNGTYVNDVRLQAPQELRDGDRLKAGPFEFRFELPTAPQAGIRERATIVMDESVGQPRLEVSSGQQRGRVFDLTRERTVIGRAGQGQQWDITLPDRAVSRPHAEILKQPDGFVLKDLGSANGTLVNGVRLADVYKLADGDAITFGEVVLVYRAGGA